MRPVTRLPAEAHAPFLEGGVMLTPEVLSEQEEKFVGLLEGILERASAHRVTLRVIGSLAFRVQCPDYKYMEYENARFLTDIDFVGYSRDIAGIQDLFLGMRWEENMTVLRLFGDTRRVFYHPELPLHSDVFLDKLRFCHEIDFRGRLELEYPTIPLADLLLEKLQIVEINKKDLIDIMVLLRQFPVGLAFDSESSIDGTRVAAICGNDWGWWRTTTRNIEKTMRFASEYLSADNATIVQTRLATLAAMVDTSPKGLRWKARALVGERVKWYREVEELQRD
ncbi:hypothetical protein JXA88_04340 [Candidatus Fermentibacteria bacterium]|nr:hypothetical protein [Candidatus Fermentibacteria bacterium]